VDGYDLDRESEYDHDHDRVSLATRSASILSGVCGGRRELERGLGKGKGRRAEVVGVVGGEEVVQHVA